MKTILKGNRIIFKYNLVERLFLLLHNFIHIRVIDCMMNNKIHYLQEIWDIIEKIKERKTGLHYEDYVAVEENTEKQFELIKKANDKIENKIEN